MSNYREYVENMENQIINITLKKGMPIANETSVALQPLISDAVFFKGDEGNPLLAPRGVFFSKKSPFCI